jgi:hypothetical protein
MIFLISPTKFENESVFFPKYNIGISIKIRVIMTVFEDKVAINIDFLTYTS